MNWDQSDYINHLSWLLYLTNINMLEAERDRTCMCGCQNGWCVSSCIKPTIPIMNVNIWEKARDELYQHLDGVNKQDIQAAINKRYFN